MEIKKLLELWEKSCRGRLVVRKYPVRLPIREAARVAALAEMYPMKSQAEIIAELLAVALDGVEAAFPYVQGSRVIAEDERGDPIYEDVGPTPRFLELTRKHAALLTGDSEEDDECSADKAQ